MATLTLTSGTITRQFGTVSVQINLENRVDATTALGVTLFSLPKLSQTADVQDDTDAISDFKLNLSDVSFEVGSILSDGSDLFTYLDGLFTSDFITIQVTTSIGAGTDYFYTTKSECEYDWRRRTVSFNATSPLRYDNVVTAFDISSVTLDGGFVTQLDLIKSFLNTQGSSPTWFVTWDYYDLDFAFLDVRANAVSTAKYIAYLDTDVDTYTEAQDIVLKTAIQNGSIIGNMFGYAYFVGRTFTGTTNINGTATHADINASDLKDYAITFNSRNVKDYSVTIGTRDDVSAVVLDAVDSETINSNGSQDVTVVCPNLTLLKTIDFNGGTDLWESGSGVAYLTQAQVDAILVDATASYRASLGIESSYAIELTILGIDKLLPFQFIDLGTDIHPALDNKLVRPSEIEYDLEQNIITLKGYFI